MDGFYGGGRNSFALVGYLPEPLAGFVDRLRSDLAPGCQLRAHITVLPPRPLNCSPESAWREMQVQLRESSGFPIELHDVQQFAASGVIYISLGVGFTELDRLHERLNGGFCKSTEAWRYHPHVTLAQGLPDSLMAPFLEHATREWHEYHGARRFMLDRLTFVQNVAAETCQDQWADLEAFDLRPAVTV
jgi:2'-5' RNA ligase